MSQRRNKKTVTDNKQQIKLRSEFEGKTYGQKEYIRAIYDNTVTFVTGPAGSGKSFLAIGVACRGLINGDFDKIVLARPTIEASPKGLGFLPGDLNAKLNPYLLPAISHLKNFLGENTYQNFIRDKKIVFEPLEYMRGRTFDNSFMILEEAQNCTKDQLVMFVTRIGENSKIVIDGDIEQTDLRRNDEGVGDLEYVMQKMEKSNLDEFKVFRLTENDIVRNRLIKEFLRVFK